jgi:hypothetical protein
MKVAAHCGVWLLAFCAMLVSPVILIFGVPLAIGVGTDIVQAGAAPFTGVLVAAGVTLLSLCKSPVRASARALLRSVLAVGHKPLAASPHAAKSIS